MQTPWYAKFVVVLFAGVVLSGCSNTPEDPYADKRDPFEDMNRAVWDFNQQVDKAVLKPTAEVYENIPEPVRHSLYRAFENLQEPWSFLNHLLQGKPAEAGTTLGRFVLNTTVGMLGLTDPATALGINKQEEKACGMMHGRRRAIHGPTRVSLYPGYPGNSVHHGGY